MEELTAGDVVADTPVQPGATRIQLFPFGSIMGRDGRGPFIVQDRAHAEAIVATTRLRQGSTDIAIDYDHQMVYAVGPGNGGAAIAAGWIKPANLIVADDGIWAEGVEWTPAATTRLANREYRYVSPYYGYGPDGRVTRIINVGLVNVPNFDLAAAAGAQPAPIAAQLTEEERAVAFVCGLSDDQFAAARADDAATRELRAAASLPRWHTLNGNEKLTGDERAYCAMVGLTEKEFFAALPAEEQQARRNQHLAIERLEGHLPAEPMGIDGEPLRAAAAALNETERAVCFAMGIRPDEFVNLKAAEGR